MIPETPVAQDLVLDLTSFQLIRGGERLKLEKTPMEILTLLARRRGALVTRDEIVSHIWGGAVHVDVDAGINTAIRKIRSVLDDDPASPRYLETVVGKGYRFVGPIKLVETDAPAPPAAENSRPTRLNVWWAVAALVGASVMGFAAYRLLRRPGPERGGHLLIAVSPLQNLSGDPGQEYLAAGLTEEIITQLGQLNPDRIGVVRYRTVPPEMPRDPRAQYLLEGGVRREGAEARISVRLIRTVDDTAVWTASFDREVGDVLALQSEIAQHIGHKLQVMVTSPATTKPAASAVVEAYLRGRFELDQMEVRDAAREYFGRAIDLDPSYAPAYAGLADFYRERAVQNDEGSDKAWKLAERYADQAVALDDESAASHAAMAQIKLMHDWDWNGARQHALRALQLNPSSPDAHAVYARYLQVVGDLAGAVEHRKQALALDPFRPDLKHQLTFEYFFARDYRSAVASARAARAQNPDYQWASGDLCANLPRLQMFDEAVTECSKELAREGHTDWVAPYLHEYRTHSYAAADHWVSKKWLANLLSSPHPDLWDLANAYVMAGERDEAMTTLFRGLPAHEPGLLQLRIDPDFDPIRNDPRYAELVRRIGFPKN